MKALFYAVLVFALVSTACSSGGNQRQAADLGEGTYQEHAYEFSTGSCTTNRKEFSSQDEMCWILQSESQNRFCAESMRAEYFRANCSGSFTPRA